MKWGKSIELARTSPEVCGRVRASPSESEVQEDFGVTGHGSDAKGVGRKEVERKGNERDVCKSPWDEGKEKGRGGREGDRGNRRK